MGESMNTTFTLNLHRVDNRKSKAKSTLIVDLLKKFDIPGGQATGLYQKHGKEGGEYIVRKCFLLEYWHHMKKPVGDNRRWLIAAINNDWDESDAFKDWYKRKKEYILNNGNDDMKQLLSI